MTMLLRASVVAVLAAIASTAYADTGFVDRSVAVNGRTFWYQVYVPRDFTATRTWPVIVNLHGGGSHGDDGLIPTITGWAPLIRRDRRLVSAIVLFPQATPGRSWADRDMQDLVILQLERTIEEFQGDRSRLYLTGFSMGGAGTYRMACRWPDRFAAIIAVSGPVESGLGSPSPDAASRDREANPYTAATDPSAALAAAIRQIPIWVFHGDADRRVPVEQSRRIVAALKTASARVQYTEFPGLDHNDAGVKAFGDAATLSWLLSQHR